MTEAEAEAAFLAKLAEFGMSRCKNCGQEIGLGDLSWNSASTEEGTDYATALIQCTTCQTKVAHWYSPLSEADNIVEFVAEILPDLNADGRGPWFYPGPGSEGQP